MNGHLKGEPPRYPTARCIMRDNCGHDLRLRYRSRAVSSKAEKTTKGAADPARSNRPPSKPIRLHRTESMTAAPSCACCCAHLLGPRARGPPAMRPSSATACRPCCLYTTAFFNAGSRKSTLGSSDPAPTPRLWRSERTLGGVYEASTANRRRVHTVLVMSKDSHIEAIDPNLLYNAEKLRRIEGISLAEMKKFIRENCVYSEAWQGRLNALGSDYIDAMSRSGLVDSE